MDLAGMYRLCSAEQYLAEEVVPAGTDEQRGTACVQGAATAVTQSLDKPERQLSSLA